MTWAMHYTPSEISERGLQICRFEHPQRNDGGRARVPLRHKLRFLGAPLLDSLGRTRVLKPSGVDDLDGHQFVRRQGPYCKGIVSLLREGQDRFDAAVFFTALYHPTAEGLPVWGPRSVLVPTLHDEKAMYLPLFHQTFATAGTVLWNTAAERRLAGRMYGELVAAKGCVVGAAASATTPTNAQIAQARIAYGIPERYLVCVGRVEAGKGCAELLNAWRRLGSRIGDYGLVFVGQGSMALSNATNVFATGFVEAPVRDALMAGARALVVPSRKESLSLVLLEAMAMCVPVLANGQCEALSDHIEASGGGTAFRGGRELMAAIWEALTRDDNARARMGQAGRRYVQTNYSAEVIKRQWLHAVEQVCEKAESTQGQDQFRESNSSVN